MGIADDALVTILVADYLAADAAGKINAIGAGFTLSGMQPNGFSAAQYVGVQVHVPSKYAGQEFALTVTLYNEDSGEIATAPGPTGEESTIRIAQVMKVPVPQAHNGVYLPPQVDATVQSVLGFPAGLPLSLGTKYSWRVDIDGHPNPAWRSWFYVPGPPPGPVIGGPVSPTDLNLPAL